MTTLAVAKPRVRREDLAAHECLCDYCSAKCCRYFALPIETPTDWNDFEYIRWYLLHGQSSVFVDSGVWYLCVHTDCKHLLPDNRCGTYLTRPPICREYSTSECEYDETWVYEMYLETAEQVVEYAEAALGPKPGESLRSAEPPVLPVL